MNDIAGERVAPMLNPPRPGDLIRESMEDMGWNVTETAARLGCERGTLSRLRRLSEALTGDTSSLADRRL